MQLMITFLAGQSPHQNRQVGVEATRRLQRSQRVSNMQAV